MSYECLKLHNNQRMLRIKNIRSLGFFLFVMFNSSVAIAQDITGVWKGHYMCGSRGGATLTFYTDQLGNTDRGQFEFYQADDGPYVPNGSYLFNIKKISDTLRLIPKQWIQHPTGYDWVETEISIDEKTGNLVGRLIYPGCGAAEFTQVSKSTVSNNATDDKILLLNEEKSGFKSSTDKIKYTRLERKIDVDELTKEEYPEAIKFFQQYLLSLRDDIQKQENNSALFDRDREVRVLINIARGYRKLENYTEAIKYYQQALVIDRELSSFHRVAILNSLSDAHSMLKQDDLAVKYRQQAAELPDDVKALVESNKLNRKISRGEIERKVYRSTKLLSHEHEEYLGAIENEKNSLSDLRKHKDSDTPIYRSQQSNKLISIAKKYTAVEKFPLALEYYEQALNITRQSGSPRDESQILNDMGSVYEQLSQLSKALDYYKDALSIRRKCCDVNTRNLIIDSLYKVGHTYYKLSKPTKSIEYYKQVGKINNEIGYHEGEAKAMYEIAEVYASNIDDYHKAIDYYQQALMLRRELGANHLGVVMNILGKISGLYSQLGDTAKAQEYFGYLREAETQLNNNYAQSYAEILKEGPSDDEIARDKATDNAIALLANSSEDPDRVFKKHEMEKLFDQALDAMFSGDNSLSIQRYKEALAIANDLKDVKRTYFLEQLVILTKQQNEEDESREYFQQLQTLRGESNDSNADGINELSNPESDNFAHLRVPSAEEQEEVMAWVDEFGDDERKAAHLRGMGDKKFNNGEYTEAIEIYKQVLTITQNMNDGNEDVSLLIRIGDANNKHGQYSQALKYFHQALNKGADEVICLNYLGHVNYHLGQYSTALKYFEQSLAISYEELHLVGAASTLNNIANIHLKSSEFSKAKEKYQQSLSVEIELGNRVNEGIVLNNLGRVSVRQGRYSEALNYHLKSFKIARKNNHRSSEVSSLISLGTLHGQLKQYSKAFRYFYLAVSISAQIEEPESLWRSWSGLSEVFSAINQPGLAIVASKQSVNTLQGIRSNISSLEQDLQKGFLEDKKYIYRKLADILIEQGRISEAEQVMAMLKEEEYFDFIQRDGKEDNRSTKTSFTSAEQKVVVELNQYNAKLSKLGKKYEGLSIQSKTDDSKKIQLADVEAELEKYSEEYISLLSTFTDLLKGSSDENAIALSLERAQGQQKMLMDINAALITTVMTGDKLHLVLTTSEGQVARQSPISEKSLNKLIERFRNALKHSGSDPKRLAQELYQHLVRPLEKDLEQLSVTTLMWSLDGSLRYIPLAVLHDGKQYLIERYALSLYTAAAHNNFNENNTDAWRVAGLGVSLEHPGFSALPAVPQELESIVRRDNDDQDGVIPGKISLDQAFNRASLTVMLREKYPVLHIASHFKLQPGNGSASTLLLGDGSTMSMSEFRRQDAFKLHGVDLMTLSACDTAVGSRSEGGEVESFAVLAQQRGAKGVLASLWKVEDASTSILMQTMYQRRSQDTHLSKAEGLRQAQLALLHGEIDSDEDFSHPYFWAPFVMMGNWL